MLSQTPEAFFERKRIDPQVFKNISLTVQSPLTDHSACAFEHFYSKPYLNHDKTGSIARFYHGIAHANRVASYISVFANLYKKHGSKDASAVTDDDLKLIQIAALFHDSCRENDDKDLWDNDSGILLYLYLKAIGVDENKAILLAEAIANKDVEYDKDHPDQKQYALKVDASGKMSWEETNAAPKNIYQRLIHDADCIDIIRARDHFDATYLDFYKEVAKNNSIALDEMAQLITEVRSVIERQGDSKQINHPDIKEKYECAKGLARSIATWQHNDQYKILSTLYNNGGLLPESTLKSLRLIDDTPYDPSKGLEINNLRRAMREGKLFSRGLVVVSGVSAKKVTLNDGTRLEESLASIDIRKAKRRLGVPTSSSKNDKENKNGNLHRSISMLSHGSATFPDVGLLILAKPEHNQRQ